MPNDPKEKMSILMNLLNEGMDAKKKGLLSDWESFSNLSGYFVMNGTDMEVMQFLTKYSSHLKFSQPTMIVSLEQAIENYTKLAKMVAVAPKQ
jgi:hypothetical protein